MKIAVDCRFIGKSGIGTYIENYVDCLISEHPEHNYLLICDKDCSLRECKNVELLKTGIKPFSLKELFLFPVSAINQCDCYFSPNYNLPLGIKVPVFCTIHDVIFLDMRELTSHAGYWIRKTYLWNAIRISKAIFTVSEFSKNRILYHFKTKKNIFVTYSAISSAIKEAATNRFVKRNPPYIIYVGNIKKNKGLKVLLKGYQEAVTKGFVSDLYIVGNANKFKTGDTELNSLIEGNEKVVFTGYVPNERLFKLIAEAELLVLPSSYEGFGLTPLEGLYLGTDVLISDIDVLKEVYCKLPVTFFKCNDAHALSEALLNHKQKNMDLIQTRRIIDDIYNTSTIANIILDEISSSLSK